MKWFYTLPVYLRDLIRYSFSLVYKKLAPHIRFTSKYLRCDEIIAKPVASTLPRNAPDAHEITEVSSSVYS